MPELAQLEAALRKADEAANAGVPGASDDARSLAGEIRKMRGQGGTNRSFDPSYQGAISTPGNSALRETVTGATSPGQPGYVPQPREGAGAGFMANLKAGLPEDEETKLQIFAKSLFPNDPDARKRVGYMNQRPAYIGDDGNYYYADSGFASKAGSAVAYAPEAVGGLIGSAATGNPATGAVIGDVGGRAVKRGVSGLVFEEPLTAGSVTADLAQEGAVAAFAGGLGKALVGGATRVIHGKPVVVPGAEKIDPAAIVDKIEDTKRKTGITLDYTQAADDADLRGIKRFAGDHPASMKQVDNLKRQQTGEIEASVRGLLNQVSSETDRIAMGSRAVQAAQQAIEQAEAARGAAARPFYEAAARDTTPVDISSIEAFLERQLETAKGGHYAELRKMQQLLQRTDQPSVGGQGVLENRIGALHNAKLEIDAAIDKYLSKQGSASASTLRDLTDVKNRLVQAIEGVSSDYRTGNRIYEQLTRDQVDPLKDGMVGALARIKNVRVAKSAATIADDLLDSPEDIVRVRNVLQMQDPEAWNQLIKNGLVRQFRLAGRKTGVNGNYAAQLRHLFFGDEVHARATREALGPNASLFTDIMDAMDLVAKDFSSGSSTVPKAQVAAEQAEAAKPKPIKLMQAIRMLWSKKGVPDAIATRLTAGRAKDIAAALTDPQKLVALRQLKRIPQGAERAMLTLGIVTGDITAEQVDSLWHPVEDQIPEAAAPPAKTAPVNGFAQPRKPPPNMLAR